jgi:hypothetical protein
MNKPVFSSRNLFIILPALMLFTAILACNGGAPVNPPSGTGDAENTPQPVVENTAEPSFTQAASVPTGTPSILAPSPQPAINEMRRLTLEFPVKMRAGVEGDIVRLTLEVDDLRNITPTAQIEGNVVVGETIEIPDLYDTHNVTAEASLDLAGMEVQPPDAIYEPLKRGQSATFYWSIRPQEAGTYRGTVWLHLNFEDRSTGEKSRIAVSAQIIEIKAVDFFGLSVNLARAGGVVGSVVGGVVGFPFLEDIIKLLFKRRKKS